MNKFIFYKGKYYTKNTIQTLHNMCEYSIELAKESINHHRETLDLYENSLYEDKSEDTFDFLLIILICVSGIKIGTLL